ncbi:MAG: F0F1 ATP synthase subunit gamma [Gammaproteobacteria bacterium]
MEAIEQLHDQLDSLDELRTIVKTMKALSAASVRQYEQAVDALASYYRTVERGLHVVLKDMQQPVATYNNTHEPQRLAAIVFGSDHGLCGRFNEEIATYALEHLKETQFDAPHRLVLAVGARVAGSLEQENQLVEDNFMVPGSAVQITATVQQILLKIDEWREQSNVQDVYLFYNRHSERGSYQPTGFRLLPVDISRFREVERQRWPSRSLPTFTMNRESLLRRLLNQYLFVTIFRGCAESQASEHSSRLAAMQSAERNLDDRIEEVTMEFRRARQNAITAELLDVVMGFETLTAGKS